MTKSAILEELGLGTVNSGACGKTWIETPGGPELTSLNPATAQSIAKVRMASANDYERVVEEAQETFLRWRMLPAPKRGEIVREIGNELRKNKDALGALVSPRDG